MGPSGELVRTISCGEEDMFLRWAKRQCRRAWYARAKGFMRGGKTRRACLKERNSWWFLGRSKQGAHHHILAASVLSKMDGMVYMGLWL